MTRFAHIWWKLVTAAVCLGWVLAGRGPSPADTPQHRLGSAPKTVGGSIGRAARENAIQGLPLERLDPRNRARVQSVVANVSLFRRMPISMVRCDPDLFAFSVEHPDVIVNIWRVLGISQISVEQIGPGTYRVDDGAGTRGTVEYLLRSRDTQLVYVEGSYSGPPLPKPVEGRGVLLLKSASAADSEGRALITSRMDAFIAVEPGPVELMTRTLQPLLGKVADLNFQQTVGFLATLSRTAEFNPPGIQRLTAKMTRVHADVRQEFAEICSRVSARSAGQTATPLAETPLMVRRSTIQDTPPAATGTQ